MTPVQTVFARVRNATLIALCVCLLALAVHQAGWLAIVELKSLDYRFQVLAQPSHALPDIVLVTVDEASLEALGRWPWPRDVHGYAVKFLKEAGARVIAFDILFLEPDQQDPQYDDEFAREVSAAGNVFFAAQLQEGNHLPAYHSQTEPRLPAGEPPHNAYLSMEGAKYPIPPIGRAAQGIGFVNLTPDKDGTTRSIPLFGQAGERVIPSLSMLIANAVTGNQKLQFEGNVLQWGKTRVPLNEGRLLINWHGTIENATYQAYSMGMVVRSALETRAGKPPLLNPGLFKDKIVFIGSNAAGTYDLRVTPLSPYTSGVLIHMAALDDLLRGRFLSPASWSIFALSTLVLCLLTAWSFVLSQTQLLKVGGMAMIFFLYIGIVTIAFANAQLWLQAVIPLGAQGVTFAAVATVEYFTEGRTRRQLRLAFDKYMSAEVVDEIMRSPESIVLGGEQRELSVLFSDVAGFTTISEQLTPQELVTLLNRYLTAMGATIRCHRGNVNKYLGDGIMAIFGAPLRDPDHAVLACRAALAMQATLTELRETWKSEGYPLIQARIGISTGPLIVGNVGSEERLEYTVIGDTVNLASRLEGANKYYGTGILIGPRAYELAKSEIIARPVDFLRVKGKTQPVLVYELMGMTSDLNRALCAKVDRYAEGFAAYRSRDFAQAQACFEKVLAEDPDDGLAKVYCDRIKLYRVSPPPVDWDGVYTLESK